MDFKDIAISNQQVYVSIPCIEWKMEESELFIIGVVTIINPIYVLVLSESPYNFTGYTIIYDAFEKHLITKDAYFKRKIILTDLNKMQKDGFLFDLEKKYKEVANRHF